MGKPLKKIFWTQFAQKRGHYGPRPRWKKIFFGTNNKSRSSAFRKFLFYQNICFDWVMNLFLSWVIFSVKKVSFPEKKTVQDCRNLKLFFLSSFCYLLFLFCYILFSSQICFPFISLSLSLFLLVLLYSNSVCFSHCQNEDFFNNSQILLKIDTELFS